MIAQTTLLAPIAQLQECTPAEANGLLVEWKHRMGPLERGQHGYARPGCYVLLHHDLPVAVATHSTLIRDHVGGGLTHLTRADTIELSRLCAARSGLCRIMLRMWREFVFPALGYRFAISYQDAVIHGGYTYKHDGWTRSPEMSRSGTDNRTDKVGRAKWIWYWELSAARERSA